MAKRYKMKMRVMVLYLLIVLVPTVVLFGLYIHVLTAQMEQEVTHTMLQALRQSALRVGNNLENLKSVSNYLFSSSTFNKSLAADPERQKMEDQLEEMDAMSNTLQAATESANLDSVRVYVPDGKIYARERQEFFPLSEFYADQAFKNISAKGEYLLLTLSSLGEPEEKECISYVRLVKEYGQVEHTIGALAVNYSAEWIGRALKQLDFPEDSLVCLTDSSGRVLLGDRERGSLAAPWEDQDFRPQAEMSLRWGGKTYLIQYIQVSGWYLVAELPDISLFENGHSNWVRLVLYVVLLMSFIGLVMVAFSLIISSVAHRVQQLASVFEGVGGRQAPEKAENRPGLFFQTFKRLDESLENAQQLIRTSYEQMEQQCKTQLMLLQAQINPHFLYNILDTIQWLVRAERTEDSLAVISDLTRYLRLTLNNGRVVVTVHDEVEMTKAYLQIQQARFGEGFDLDFIIEPDTRGCLLPKMTLQPIIENAFLHGIRPLTQRRGRIDIDIYREEGFLIIAVTDNGVGMDQKTLDNLLKFQPAEKNGYGLYNVNQRIQLFSPGTEAGISVESEEGKYTMVTLRMGEKEGPQEEDRA